MSEYTRQPCVAGRFYPDKASILKVEVQKYLSKSAEHRTSCSAQSVLPPYGLMLPHAGYVFSGLVAGLTLGQVPAPDRVVLLGPNHTGRGKPVAVWPAGEWLTPLGAVPVESELADALCAGDSPYEKDCAAHTAEHSLEVLLPFLQVMNPQIKILPVCVREYNPQTLALAGSLLADLILSRPNENITIIASSDMSHYIGPDEARRRDSLALEEVLSMNPDGLYNVVRSHNISMCGVAPVAVMLHACKKMGVQNCCLTAYTNSGVTGAAFGADKDKVVAYAGVIIPRE